MSTPARGKTTAASNAGSFATARRGEANLNLDPPTDVLWDDHARATEAAAKVERDILAAVITHLGYKSITVSWTEDRDFLHRRVPRTAITTDGRTVDIDGTSDQWHALDEPLANLTNGDDLLRTPEDEEVTIDGGPQRDLVALRAEASAAWGNVATAWKKAAGRSWTELTNDVRADYPNAVNLRVANSGDDYQLHNVYAVAAIDADGTEHELTQDEQDRYGEHLDRLTGYFDPLPYADTHMRSRYQEIVDLNGTSPADPAAQWRR